MREAPLPLRLAYVAPVFRYYEQPQEGRMRELTQAGVELIGAAGVDADAETLFMAIEALDEIGLRDARFDINDARVVDGVLAGVGLARRGGARGERADQDAQPRRAARASDTAARWSSSRCARGGRERDRDRARDLPTPDSLAALDALDALLARAEALGYGGRVTVDFALLRDLEYYTGFIFEGYVERDRVLAVRRRPLRLAAAALRLRRPGGRLDRRRRALPDRARAARQARRRRQHRDRRARRRLRRRRRARARGGQRRALSPAPTSRDEALRRRSARARHSARRHRRDGAVRELRVGPRVDELPVPRTPSNWDAR